MDIHIRSLSALSALRQSAMRIEILDFTSNPTQLQYFYRILPYWPKSPGTNSDGTISRFSHFLQLCDSSGSG